MAVAVRRARVALAMILSAIALAASEPSLAQSSPQDELAAAAAADHSAHYEDAVRHYRNFLDVAGHSASSSDLAEVRTRLATALFMLHRYQESLEALEPLFLSKSDTARGVTGTGGSKEAPSQQTLPAQAWLVRGLDYLQLSRPGDVGHFSEATSSLRRALELNPKSGTARMALGDALARSDDLEQAADEYREQTRLTPDLADAWYKLGSVYTDLGGKIAADFARTQPRNRLGIQLSAERLSDSGDYWGAAQALFPIAHSLTSDPIAPNHGGDGHAAASHGQDGHATFYPGLHATFGIALVQLGYSRAAEREFKAELSQDAESMPAQFGMMEVEALRSNWAQALDTLRRLMSGYPKELATRLELPPPPALLKVSGAGKAALPPDLTSTAPGKQWSAWLASAGLESRQQLESSPESDEARCSAPASSRQREPGYWLTEACTSQLLDDLRSRRDLTEKERVKLIEAEYRLGDHKAAQAGAQSLLKMVPGDSWGRYWLAKSYSALAGQCFARLAEVSPDSARVHEILARYHSERQQLAAARAEYEAALRLDPQLPDLHVGLGTVYWQSGDWTRAEAELKRALELSPGSAVAAYELGDCYIQQRQWQPAAHYLQPALSDPAVERKARLDLAKAEDELGNPAAAIQELTLLAQDDPDGQVHYRLAMAYRETGDAANAKAALATSEALRKSSDQLSIERLESLQNESGSAQNTDIHPK
jgi:tetratricopeptide (TPR) repeat protein